MRSPTRRAALAVSVALLLVTAGCLGGTAPTGPSASPTPETAECTYDVSTNASNATGTWSPNASVEQYPPGVADNGTLTNASTLLNAHFTVTANTSMALRLESSRDNVVRTLVHGPDRTPFYSTWSETHDGEQFETEFYGTESHGFARASKPNETLHFVYQNVTSSVRAWTAYETFGGLEDNIPLLYDGNYTVNGTVERGDRTLVELTLDEDSLGPDYTTNGTLLATPDGVVYDADVSVVKTSDDAPGQGFEASMSLNTDVEWCGPPSWVADVPQLSLTIVEDGHAVEIRNTGGATLPANTSFSVYGKEEPVEPVGGPRVPVRSEQNGTVTTDVRLEPGEAVYVTAGADGTPSSFALHDDPTRGEYSFGAVGVTGGKESVGYRLLTGVTTPEWEE